jgi:2-dehydro-3-deoxygluconokinase
LPGIDEAVADAATADLLIFSLITLAILPDKAREAMLDLADRVRQHGGHVAFDGNYRPLLWRDVAQARYWHGRALAVATIGLPTLDDEHALNGSCDAASVVEHWQRQGMSEVAVKLGAKGCLTNDDLMVTPPHIVQPIDTSGAGDAFNAGYLHARLGGAPCDRAAAAGHRLAGWVIGRRGAVPSPDAQAPYAALRDLAD